MLLVPTWMLRTMLLTLLSLFVMKVDEAQGGKITLGLSIVVRVTLRDGTYHEVGVCMTCWLFAIVTDMIKDIGYGHIENCKSKAAAFEKAKKEAATDALKRSLRTFGNVLGNCLYDKEYLSRVTKVRFGKQRWNIDDLHRHSSYVEKEKEESGERATNEEKDRPNGMPGKDNQKAAALPNFADAEDEFGGNVFDEMDFDSHTDGVVIEPEADLPEEADIKMERKIGSPIKTEQMSKSGPENYNRTVPRVQSTPNLRPGKQSQEDYESQTRKPMNDVQPQIAIGRTGRPNPHEARPGAIHANLPSAQAGQIHQQPINASNYSPNPIRSAPSGGPESASKTNTSLKPTSAVPTEDLSIGFTASRNAEILQKIEPEATSNTPLPVIAVAPFNPHLDSPSIRRTSHISHNKSAPISRQAINAPPGPQPANPDQSLSRTTNFINPQADPTRKIGMPATAASSPAPNRSAYKPPGMVNANSTAANANPNAKRASEQMARVPLADVSNAHPNPGNLDERDAKRTRMMG